MRTTQFAALCATLLAATPLLAAVTVTYGDADRFTDAGDRNTDPRKVMEALEKHLKALGGKYIPQENLAIEVFDLDRAGRPRMNLPTEIRVVSGKGDPPCIDLSYSLASAPAVRERVCDAEFLRPLEFRYDVHDPLVYEKRMLDEWFQRRFAKGAPR
jgi:hypothetical protein